MKTIILSAFPGTGKTYLFNNQEKLGLSVLDSDSSEFSWCYDEEGNKKCGGEGIYV